MNPEATIASLAERARADRAAAKRRWAAAGGPGPLARAAERFRQAGRVTLNFHPDRVARGGRTVAAGLLADGRYRSQWVTGISAGSRSAVAGGDRQRFERELFAGAYDHVDASLTPHPVYGSLDLLLDEHGGSPRFGSGFAVLRAHVRERTTLCLGQPRGTARRRDVRRPLEHPRRPGRAGGAA